MLYLHFDILRSITCLQTWLKRINFLLLNIVRRLIRIHTIWLEYHFCVLCLKKMNCNSKTVSHLDTALILRYKFKKVSYLRKVKNWIQLSLILMMIVVIFCTSLTIQRIRSLVKQGYQVEIYNQFSIQRNHCCYQKN